MNSLPERLKVIALSYVQRWLFVLPGLALVALILCWGGFALQLITSTGVDRQELIAAPYSRQSTMYDVPDADLLLDLDNPQQLDLRFIPFLTVQDLAPSPSVISLTFLVVLWGVCLGTHLREQLLNARASLTPGYRPPHLLVSGALSLLLVVVFPLLMTMAGGVSPWPLTGATVVVFGMALWLVTGGIPSLFTSLPLYGVFMLSVLMDSYLMVESQFLLGAYPSVAAALLITGLLLVGLYAAHLLWMDEETPGYHRQAGLNCWNLRGRNHFWRYWSTPDRARSFGWAMRPLDQLHGYHGDHPMARIRLWQIADPQARSIFPSSVMMGLFFPVFWFLGGDSDHSDFHWACLISIYMMAALFPSAISLIMTFRRWPLLGWESLRPVSRRQFVREQGLATLKTMYLSWAGFMLASVLVWLIVLRDELKPVDGVMLLLLSGVWQISGLALVAWVSSFRWLSFLMVVLILSVASLLPMVPGGLYLASRHMLGPGLSAVGAGVGIAAVELLAGWALLRAAEKRWEVIELA